MSNPDDALVQHLRARLEVQPRRPMWEGDTPTWHPAATEGAISLAEGTLGFSLPPLLRRIYTEVADGGFGPAYGVFPIASRYSEAGQEATAVEVRVGLADSRWPKRLLPICDWGCANWSCLDCGVENGSIITLAGENGFFDTGRDLRSWLDAWLNGVDLWEEMFEPRITPGINPFTKQPIEIKGQGAPRGRPWPDDV